MKDVLTSNAAARQCDTAEAVSEVSGGNASQGSGGDDDEGVPASVVHIGTHSEAVEAVLTVLQSRE